MQIRRCQPSESRLTEKWVAERHYLECAPAGYAFVLEFTEGKDLIGAHIWGKPQAATYDPERVIQLYRLFFVDGTERFVESRSLAQSRKFIRTWFPQIKLCLSYSDPAEGHSGAIYEADNWAPFGMTRERRDYGFQTHQGRVRTKKDITPKQRWVRTP